MSTNKEKNGYEPATPNNNEGLISCISQAFEDYQQTKRQPRLDGQLLFDKPVRERSTRDILEVTEANRQLLSQPHIEIRDHGGDRIIVAAWPRHLRTIPPTMEITCEQADQVNCIDTEKLLEVHLDNAGRLQNDENGQSIKLIVPFINRRRFYKKLKKAGWSVPEYLLSRPPDYDQRNNR